MSITTDVLIIIPLQEEFEYIRTHVFKDLREDEVATKVLRGIPNLYRQKHRDSGLDISVFILRKMSNELAALMTERCISTLRPRLVVGIGIAGSLDEINVLLGDVVVSQSVCNYFAESKVIDIEMQGENLTNRDNFVIRSAAPAQVYTNRQELVDFFLVESRFLCWKSECKELREKLSLHLTHEHDKAGVSYTTTIAHDSPKLVIGNIASGPMVGSSEIFKSFLVNSISRLFHALEMEGGGIALACKRQPREETDFLLFRGISDFADKNKTNLERSSKDKWRELAATNAALLVDTCLRNNDFKNLIKPRPVANRTLNIALLLSDHVHYVDSIAAGFRDELSKIYNETHSWPHFVQNVCSNTGNINDNIDILRTLVADARPKYIVTIGTPATRAALEIYKDKRNLVFLGVSEPEKMGFIVSDRIAGVAYGVDIIETISIIKEAFPHLRPIFLHDGTNRFPQDRVLLESLRQAYSTEDVPDLRCENPKNIENCEDCIFFGRYFICKNIRQLTDLNPEKPFVAVSVENLMKGAIMTIGYDTLEIGRMGAREILAAHDRGAAHMRDIGVLRPKTVSIGYNEAVAIRIGLDVDDKFRSKITHYLTAS